MKQFHIASVDFACNATLAISHGSTSNKTCSIDKAYQPIARFPATFVVLERGPLPCCDGPSCRKWHACHPLDSQWGGNRWLHPCLLFWPAHFQQWCFSEPKHCKIYHPVAFTLLTTFGICQQPLHNPLYKCKSHRGRDGQILQQDHTTCSFSVKGRSSNVQTQVSSLS